MVNMYNNLIPKLGTIHEVRKYCNSFERERSLSNFACTVNAKTQFVLLDIILRAAYSLRQPSNFISQTGSNDLDFFPIQNSIHRPLSFRFAIAILDIMDANIGESYPVRCSCEALAARYRFYLFRNVSQNTFATFPAFFRLSRVSVSV